MYQKILQRFFKKAKQKCDKRFILIIVLLALCATLISLMIGIVQSVWFDEAYSIMLAKKSFVEITNLTAVDVHPPLYYWLLHIWGILFGWGELALRSMSSIFFGASIVVAGFLVKKIFGNKTVFYVLPLLVLSPILVRYGFEIRMYSMASFIGILGTFLLYHAVYAVNQKKKIKYFIAYSVIVAIGMFTLYYLALLWLAHLVWLVYLSKGKFKDIIKSEWLKSYMLSLILFFPWLPILIGQLSNGALAQISQPINLDNLLGIISFNFFYRPVWQLDTIYSLAVVLIVGIIIYLSINAFRHLNKIQKDALLLFAAYICIPVAVLALVGIFKPMYTERYLSHIAIGGLIYVGVIIAVAQTKKYMNTISLILLVGIFAGLLQVTAVGNYNFQRLQKPNIKALSSVVGGCIDSKKILAADPYVAIELSYYLDNCDVYFFSEQKELGGGYAPLSNSIFRVSSLKDNNLYGDIYYAYYDDNKLEIPNSFINTDSFVSGNMTISKYKIE